jgi:hypothetical protein
VPLPVTSTFYVSKTAPCPLEAICSMLPSGTLPRLDPWVSTVGETRALRQGTSAWMPGFKHNSLLFLALWGTSHP